MTYITSLRRLGSFDEKDHGYREEDAGDQMAFEKLRNGKMFIS